MRVGISISGCRYIVCPTTFCQDSEGYIRILFSDITTYGSVNALKSIRSVNPVDNGYFYRIYGELLASGSLDLQHIPFDYTR